MNEFTIKPAVREAAPITAAIIGGSGSGKTYSALKLARGLVGKGGKIVVIDSEGGRSLIYASTAELKGNDGFVFHHLPIIEPYTSARFRDAFRAAEKYGADAIIIDSISHEHEGFLEFADAEERRMSDRRDKTRARWIKPKMERRRFYNAISSSSAHCIVTIRLNRIVDMEAKPPKEIMKPECDKDFPYRLDLSVELSADHHAHYIKVPEPLKPHVRDDMMIEISHGALLAEDIGAQARPAEASEKIKRVIANLEDVAHSGTDAFKSAWEAAWRNAGPDGDAKVRTPERIELHRNLSRLKIIAQDADEDDRSGTDDPSDLGDISRPQAGEEDIFPGDR